MTVPKEISRCHPNPLICATRPDLHGFPVHCRVQTAVCMLGAQSPLHPSAVRLQLRAPTKSSRFCCWLVCLLRWLPSSRKRSTRRNSAEPTADRLNFAGALSPTDLHATPTGAALAGLQRLCRALTDRTVGLALGGGGAWGYAHVALIREIAKRGVPIDMVAGYSFGALVGAYYCSKGLAGLETLVARGKRFQRWMAMRSGLSQEPQVLFRPHPAAVVTHGGVPLPNGIGSNIGHLRCFWSIAQPQRRGATNFGTPALFRQMP